MRSECGGGSGGNGSGEVEELRDVKTEFPDWSRSRLEQAAIRHGSDLALARGHVPSNAPTDRLVVNMLRHEFTSYDLHQSQRAHQLVCEAIARRYPWLQGECDRQARVRFESERFEQELLASAALDAARKQMERKNRAKESKQAIGRFRVGMPVTAVVRGHLRDATVLKVGRTRVTIGFKLKSGIERTALIHASEIHP